MRSIRPIPSRAELLQGDLSWFAMYLIHECIDTPPDEWRILELLEEATLQLAHIRAAYMGRAHPRGKNVPVTTGRASGT